MDEKRRKEMLAYYEERASEYDEVYRGGGPASIADPGLYVEEANRIGELASAFGAGRLLDIGCGTAYWLAYYARNCEEITLFDQSDAMLREARRRVEGLGVESRCRFRRGDFLEEDLVEEAFDSAIAGFVVSHLEAREEEVFFAQVKKALVRGGELMVIDSVLSGRRVPARPKGGYQERVLKGGRRFTIYKRYFEEEDIEALFGQHGFVITSRYVGETFFAAAGRKRIASVGGEGNGRRVVKVCKLEVRRTGLPRSSVR